MSKPPAKQLYATPRVPAHWHAPGCDCVPGVAYIRVSKVGTRTKLISPDLQLREILLYAKAHNIRIVEIVTDINKSGKTFRKRSVDSIISKIRRGVYRQVVIWKWSRWARNTAESAKYLKKVRDVGGRVDSATEDMDQETAIGRLHMDITMRFDQYTAEVIGETWLSVHDQRRDAGLPHGGRARFGYDYVKNDVVMNGETVEVCDYIIKDAQAAGLADAYASYVGGQSFDVIAQALNDAGYKTTLGGTWTAQGAARMMDTGFAAGLIRERSKPTDSPANRLADYDVWRAGKHEPIIGEKTWREYRARRVARSSIAPRSRRAVHELSAMMFCSICGRRMSTKYTGAGRTHQWQCLWAKSFHPGVSVTASNRLTLIHLREEIRRIAGCDVGERINAAAEKEFRRKAAQTTGPSPAAVQAEVDRWQRKLVKLADGWADDKVSDDTYAELKATYEAERDQAAAKLTLIAPKPARTPDYRAFMALDSEWESLSKSDVREALMMLFGAIVVSPRTEFSTNASVADRVDCIGLWEADRLASMQRLA